MYNNIRNIIHSIMTDYGINETDLEFRRDDLPSAVLDNVYQLSVRSINVQNNEAMTNAYEYIIQMSFGLYKNIDNYSAAVTKIQGIINDIKEIINTDDIRVSDLDNISGSFLQPEISFRLEFQTAQINDLITINLVSPDNNYTNGKLQQSFDWSGNALRYEIEITHNGQVVVYEDKLLTSSYTIPIDKLLTNGLTYQWRVRGWNTSGYSNWSETRNFTVNELNYDEDLIKWLEGLSPQPSSARIELMDSFNKGLKTDGIWNKLDSLWIMAAETQQQANKNLKQNKYNLVPVGNPVFTIDRGYTTSTGNYLRTGTAPRHQLNYNLNSASFGLYVNTDYNETLSSVDMGVASTFAGSSYSMIYVRWANRLYSSINDNGSTPDYSNTNAVGFYALDRFSSSQYRIFKNGSVMATPSIPSSNTSELEFYIGARNFNGTADRFSNKRYALAFIGGSLTSSEHTNFYNRVLNFLTAINAN